MSEKSDVERMDDRLEQESQLLSLRSRDVLPERLDRPATKIKSSVSEDDLHSLIDFGRGLGAEDGVAVSAGSIVTNEIMRVKCRIPTCWGYNSGYFCPPHTASASDMNDIIEDYEWALLLSIPPSDSESYSDKYERINKMKEIVGRTEVEAQYTGYVNSIGFTGGPCTICGLFSPDWIENARKGKNVLQCPLYTKQSQLCFQYYRCRPAAQAVGIDMYLTAKNAGWEDKLFAPPPVGRDRMDWPCLPGVYPILIG
jgi:predicted metal-binding protein